MEIERDKDREKLKGKFRCSIDGKLYFAESVECTNTNCGRICCLSHSENYRDEEDGIDRMICTKCHSKIQKEKDRKTQIFWASVLAFLIALFLIATGARW